jgi:ABC-type polysaccharide/polyol phosphate export permease
MFEQCKNIWQRRELLFYLVTSDLKAENRNKLLGFLWNFLDPLLLMATYIVLVAVIFDRGGPQFPVLLFCAILAWRWFTSSLSRSVTSVSSKMSVVQTTRFPLAVLPLAIVTSGLVDYFAGLIILLPLLFAFDATFSLYMLWLPLLLLVQLVGTIGAALICAVIGTYLTDWGNILQFGLRLWFFLSPILYSVEGTVPKRYETVFWLNPFAALMESYKNILVRGMPPSEYMVIPVGMAIIVFVIGVWYFGREERKLVKAI